MTYLGPLRVEVIVTSDRNVKATLQRGLNIFPALGFHSESNRLLKSQMHELVLARTVKAEREVMSAILAAEWYDF